MPTYNDSIKQSLRLLYECSPNFKISIDLIQKLAQFLKLETFIDTEILATPKGSVQLPAGSKRLSIAGSLILVDIDFSENDSVSKVSLSSGNHSPGTVDADVDLINAASSYMVKESDTAIKIIFQQGNDLSFLKTRLSNSTVAEAILLKNLSGDVMGNFPVNLKYLTNLDSISPLDGDLIVYLDNIALYLNAIHAVETSLRPSDKWIGHGWLSRFGKIHLNDVESLRLGVFLHFWKDSREMERLLLEEGKPFTGRVHKALLTIEESEKQSIDILKEASGQEWDLLTDKNTLSPYTFWFDNDTHLHNHQSVSGFSIQGWKLTVSLDYPVFIPSSLLELFGISNYNIASDPENKEVFSLLEKNGFALVSVGDSDKQYRVKFVVDDSSALVPVKSFEIRKLSQLQKIIPSIRNFLVFAKFISSVMCAPGATFESPTKESNDAAKRLRDSLELSQGVTEKELLNLNSLNSAVTMEYLMFNSDADLASLAKQEAQTPDPSATFEQGEEVGVDENSLTICLNDVELTSSDCDLLFTVTGRPCGSEKIIDAQFKISNGEITPISSSEDVDMDSTATSGDFVAALSTAEDPLLAFHIIEGI